MRDYLRGRRRAMWAVAIVVMMAAWASGFSPVSVAQEPPAEPLAGPNANPNANGSGTAEAPRWEWVFFYYMSYDNNLERCGRPIIDMLKAGITSERVAVIVTADFTDTNGMQRFVLTKGNETKTVLESDGSGDNAVFAAELEWLGKNFPAKRFGIVFLNHGGRLSEMCYDERPVRRGRHSWLDAPTTGRDIAKWRRETPANVEFVFLQQCGKGALENYYAFKDAAPVVIGSQTVVGAPNFYYNKFLASVCEAPGTVDGKQAARFIIDNETANMFTTYTVVDTAKLAALPEKLDAVLAPLLAIEGAIKLPGATAASERKSATLTAGRPTMLTLEFADAGVRTITTESNLDLVMRIRDSRGRILGTDDDSGNNYNPLIAREFVAGTYTVQIFGFDPTLAGEFQLVTREGESLRNCFSIPPDEVFFDGMALLQAFYAANALDTAPLDAFGEWVKSELLIAHRVSPEKETVAGKWCGFSIYCPMSPAGLARYRESYAIYADTKLADFHARLIGR